MRFSGYDPARSPAFQLTRLAFETKRFYEVPMFIRGSIFIGRLNSMFIEMSIESLLIRYTESDEGAVCGRCNFTVLPTLQPFETFTKLTRKL